jgi:tRNA pseudouridine55 synthase
VLDGVVLIDKPAGMTSHDVVDVVRRKLGTKKVGHGGTLDPDATGLLVLGVGRATRLLAYAQSAPKRYTAVARLGSTTTTQDAAGEVLHASDVDVDEHAVASALKEFVGEIDQLPPMVSAVKIGGERLYKKARRGEEIERPVRRVTVYDAALLDFHSPEATLDIRCSAGTYVRTLVHDLGVAIGCGAHLASLRRMEAGGHRVEDAIDLDLIDREQLRPLIEAVAGMARLELDAELARLVRDGRPIHARVAGATEGEPVAVVHDGELLAVYRVSQRVLTADRVLARPSQ